MAETPVIVDAHNHMVLSPAQKWKPLPIADILARLHRGSVGAVGLIVGGDRAYPSPEASSAWEGTHSALNDCLFGAQQAATKRHHFFVLRKVRDVNAISADIPGFLIGIERLHSCFDAPAFEPKVALLGVRSVQFVGAPTTPVLEADDAGHAHLSEVAASCWLRPTNAE